MAVDSLIQDIRYAIRGLRRNPLFAASVAGTIGLGLGILCSAFTIVNPHGDDRRCRWCAAGIRWFARRLVGDRVDPHLRAAFVRDGRAIVLAASAIAAWLPSRRAARLDPAAAFRAE